LVSSALFFSLPVLAYGGLGAFFAHPPLTALALVLLAMVVAAWFAGGNMSAGVREDRANRWVIPALGILGLLLAVVPAWNDRAGAWTIDGDATRWAGVVLFAAGGALRLWPVYVLGDRFSGLVAIQPEHTLVTTGIYAVVRHPSYLGMILTAVGWSLAFRSGLGLLLCIALVPLVIVRIRAEEALLREQFGTAYDAYRARTRRLLPGLY